MDVVDKINQTTRDTADIDRTPIERIVVKSMHKSAELASGPWRARGSQRGAAILRRQGQEYVILMQRKIWPVSELSPRFFAALRMTGSPGFLAAAANGQLATGNRQPTPSPRPRGFASGDATGLRPCRSARSAC